MIAGLVAILFYLAFLIVPFVVTAMKKRRQLGRGWTGPVSATLSISNKELCCKHCAHTKFQKREGILVTSWIAFFRLSFWNQSAACYTCAQCGHVEWFIRPTEEKVEFSQD
jgi:hypothetical protein